MATSSLRSSPCPWYFFTYEMTNRRFAVTRRSAACSSPFCARRARRRSSAGSLISGSFWMSWRYWSNAVEGEERKYPLDLVSVTCCIHAPYHAEVRRQVGTPRRKFCRDGHDNSGPKGGQQRRLPLLTAAFVITRPRLAALAAATATAGPGRRTS